MKKYLPYIRPFIHIRTYLAKNHYPLYMNFLKPFLLKFFKRYPTEVIQKDYFLTGLRYNKEEVLSSFLKNVSFVSSFKNKGETCKQQMSASKLVIIDNLSTAYLESLFMNKPTICFCDFNSVYLEEGHEEFLTS